MPKMFKVIVIGGSIAGLTFAHCLDHLGIDYIILEKHEEIEARVGAFITIAPNGARILDQLGLYNAVKTVSQPTKLAYISYAHGLNLRQLWPSYLKQRLGYSSCTMTRQELLRLLYTNLNDKSKIRVNRTVVSIHTGDSGVSVSTADGGSYYGDLVVGADGVHSMTRSEMWRIARTEQPSRFKYDMSGIFADYRCAFGISDPVPGIKPGDQIMECHDGLTVIIFGGRDGLLGWCIVERLDQTYRYPDIPRYLQADAVTLCERLTNLPVRKELRFGDIWDRRKSVMMNALEEGLLQTWHYGRIVCIGDSIYKTTPTMGQGANMAIESAARLANELHRLFQNKCDQSHSKEEIIRMLEALSRAGYMRARAMNAFCQAGTRILARKGVFHTFIGRYIALRSDYLTGLWLSRILASGVTLDYLPLVATQQVYFHGLNTRKVMNFLIVCLVSVPFLWIIRKTFLS